MRLRVVGGKPDRLPILSDSACKVAGFELSIPDAHRKRRRLGIGLPLVQRSRLIERGTRFRCAPLLLQCLSEAQMRLSH